MIANSGHDERGKYSGGAAGDQTGQEWQIQPWYSRPWNYVLRYPDGNVRNIIATLAEEAAQNDRIGYDQNQRTTFWGQLQKVGYHPAKITQPCEADCSAGVAAIVKAAGYLSGVRALQLVSADMYTGNERSALQQAGFEVLTNKKYLASDEYLLRGDILLYEYHHTCINLTDGAKAHPGEWHWIKAGGKWYYQDANGQNAHGWRRINESGGEWSHWYYFNPQGAMVTGLWELPYKKDGVEKTGLFYLQESGSLEGACCDTDSDGALSVWYLSKL